MLKTFSPRPSQGLGHPLNLWPDNSNKAMFFYKETFQFYISVNTVLTVFRDVPQDHFLCRFRFKEKKKGKKTSKREKGKAKRRVKNRAAFLTRSTSRGPFRALKRPPSPPQPNYWCRGLSESRSLTFLREPYPNCDVTHPLCSGKKCLREPLGQTLDACDRSV
ncbi:hypothetical protein CEXT_87551 [Caerostris extrusa]|uniref:Uncharacterized protein n=1 Tax=Caerostris extrusa TaxID=172846 RepID=A0AAV4Y2D3_CAEEX|nr:hypothetical protein CEXT_87551 [Caerostris extrusa]